MSRLSAPQCGGLGWQLIFADLALILFLLTLSALPAAEADSGHKLADRAARPKDAQGPARADIASAQALYRPVAGGPGLSAWLGMQQPDSRATLTIFATHPAGAAPDVIVRAFARAEALAAEARGRGVPVRTIITAGAEADIYASLAYDAAITGG